MSKKTTDPADFDRASLKVTVIIESDAADATVSVGLNDSAGGIEWRPIGTATGVDAVGINPDLVYDKVRVAGHGADKFVICKGGV